MLAASSANRTVGILVAVGLSIVWLLYLWGNVRKARAERGSEIELAPNRKPYYDDEELEGPRLSRYLLAGVVLLAITAVGLPLYALNEPFRQEGATVGFTNRFATWGEEEFATTAEGGFNCAGCHGDAGVGGSADYTFTDPRTGQVRTVSWKAPALNTVLLRFSEAEVRYILTFGRPYSPMSPWGVEGGGPMNDQQINNLIGYLQSIQLTPQEAQAQSTEAFEAERAKPENAGKSDGEILFTLPEASGAFNCARCHTLGWSYDDPQVPGGGAMGPNLTGGSETRQFPEEADHEAFVTAGSENGKRYGSQGQGSGKMPGFGQILTPEQIQSIVEYERSL